MKLPFLLLPTLLLALAPVLESARAADALLLDARTLAPATPEEIAARLGPGSVLVLGEHHGYGPGYDHQRALISAAGRSLAPGGVGLSVGLEFLELPHQPALDAYLRGELAEPDFLASVGWGASYPWTHYREQARAPLAFNGWTLALNAPRALARRISTGGLANLSPAELAQLPPGFALGNAAYHARFAEIMGEHVPPEALARYFAAQSLWDDTMAWTATSHLAAHPDRALAIVVGDFHAMYFGGLPDRLRARGARDVVVVSQVEDEAQAAPDPLWGPRGDYVWVR